MDSKNKTKKRCPKGQRRNKKTGRCKKYTKPESKPKLVVKEKTPIEELLTLHPMKLDSPTKTRKRCPNGFRKDPKSGECVEKGDKTRKNKDKKQIVIPSQTPPVLVSLRKSLPKLPDKAEDIDLTVRKTPSPALITHLKSLSPSINLQLPPNRKDDKRKMLFGPNDTCNFFDTFKFFNKINTRAGDGGPKVYIENATDKTEGTCANYRSALAQKFLLHNLTATTKSLDWKNIIAPKQVLSNCWFNTFFMTAFVSDKGRKFYKFFRYFMITGKDSLTGKSIYDVNNPDTALIMNIFANLNLCIEACLMGDSVIVDLDTNELIYGLYEAFKKIKPVKRVIHGRVISEKRGFVDKGKSNNPLSFYRAFLSKIPFTNFIAPYEFYLSDYHAYPEQAEAGISQNKPDLICIHRVNKDKVAVKNVEEIKVGDLEYKLDSVISRNLKSHHFCACITVNGVELGFDGNSFSKLTPFKWRELINKSKVWGFEGVRERWNFKKNYHIFYYYRVK